MDVKNCRDCGRLFNYISGPRICPECRDAIEAKFSQVKEYINENRTAPLQKIAEDNNVSVQQIHQWVREERLVFTDDSVVGVECECCGKTIKTGKYCEECKNQMAHNLGNMYHKERTDTVRKDPRERARMRFFDS